jgi:hypothetical protein
MNWTSKGSLAVNVYRRLHRQTLSTNYVFLFDTNTFYSRTRHLLYMREMRELCERYYIYVKCAVIVLRRWTHSHLASGVVFVLTHSILTMRACTKSRIIDQVIPVEFIHGKGDPSDASKWITGIIVDRFLAAVWMMDPNIKLKLDILIGDNGVIRMPKKSLTPKWTPVGNSYLGSYDNRHQCGYFPIE